MCTPGNMPPMCSCPHEGAAVPRAFLAVVVLAGGVALAVAAGYGLWLFLAGWLLLMGAAALVSQGRDRRARGAAMPPGVTVTARDYVRKEMMRP